MLQFNPNCGLKINGDHSQLSHEHYLGSTVVFVLENESNLTK